MNRLIVLFGLTLTLSVACNSNDDSDEKAELKVIELLKTTESWNGEGLPEYLDGTPEITILKVIIPPKRKLDMHRHPVITAGVLLKGELEVVTADGDRLRLKAGAAISEVVSTWHYGANTGATPAEIIVFYAGIQGSSNTLRYSETLTPSNSNER